MMENFVAAQPYFNTAVAGAAVDVKPNGGTARLHFVRVVNTTAAALYLQIFDAVAALVTLGTTPPTWVLRLLPSEDANCIFHVPLGLTKGFSVATTTTSSGAVGASASVSALFE